MNEFKILSSKLSQSGQIKSYLNKINDSLVLIKKCIVIIVFLAGLTVFLTEYIWVPSVFTSIGTEPEHIKRNGQWFVGIYEFFLMYRRLTSSAKNQSIAKLQSIMLFGNPCLIKKPTHNIKSRRFSPIAMVFKRMFISNDWSFCRQNWQHRSAVNDPLDSVDHS